MGRAGKWSSSSVCPSTHNIEPLLRCVVFVGCILQAHCFDHTHYIDPLMDLKESDQHLSLSTDTPRRRSHTRLVYWVKFRGRQGTFVVVY